MSNIKVFVYWNLHKKCWSLRAASGPERGKVIAHRKSVLLRDCLLKVSEAGRQRVLRESRKNVHAGVEGYVVDDDAPLPSNWEVIAYNPYKFTSFVKAVGFAPVTSATLVKMTPSRLVYATQPQ